MAIIRTAADFRVMIKRRESKIRLAAIRAVEEVGDLIEDKIKRLAPRDTGELADSVEAKPVQVKGGRISVEVEIGAGMDSPHVASIEYGNCNQQAQPFIRPGFRQAAEKAPKLIARRIAAAT